jgi:hypothetical protein
MAAFVSVINVKGKELLTRVIEGTILEDLPSVLSRGSLEFSECVIESLPIDPQICARVLNSITWATPPDWLHDPHGCILNWVPAAAGPARKLRRD